MPDLMFDGWYQHRPDAVAVLALVAEEGADPVGIVQSAHGSWGVLYLSTRVLFPNHRLDPDNPIYFANGLPA